MKITNKKQLDEFLDAVDKCKGDVKLKSQYGDVYNLKSALSQFVAIGELLGEHGDELEIFCDEKADNINFFHFFDTHPEVLHPDMKDMWEYTIYGDGVPEWHCAACGDVLDRSWIHPSLRNIICCPHCGESMKI